MKLVYKGWEERISNVDFQNLVKRSIKIVHLHFKPDIPMLSWKNQSLISLNFFISF